MNRFFLLFISGFFLYSSAQAQCDACPELSEVSSDFCYTDVDYAGRCARFTYAGKTFFFQNSSGKKTKTLELPLPDALGSPSATYLRGLAGDKKKKLKIEDILFLKRALERRSDLMSLVDWDTKVLSMGYTILPSGLAYKVLEQGTGPYAKKGDKISVHYTGYLLDGKKFDSSRDRNQVFQFPLGAGRVIKGWDEGLALMNVGSRYLFRLPPDLAYGARGAGSAIPPNAVLLFDVQLVAVP